MDRERFEYKFDEDYLTFDEDYKLDDNHNYELVEHLSKFLSHFPREEMTALINNTPTENSKGKLKSSYFILRKFRGLISDLYNDIFELCDVHRSRIRELED